MAGGTSRIFETAATKMENGKNGVNQSVGWGDAASVKTLGANDGLPWITAELDEDYSFKTDNSVTTNAFNAADRLMQISNSKALSFLDRFYGQNRMDYWIFGFENAVKSVVAFKTAATPFSSTPAAGDVYSQGGFDYTFLRKEQARVPAGNTYVDVYVFESDGTNLPTASGTLTAVSTETFDYTSNSGQMYEHLYELDKFNRNLREYVTAEQTVLTTGDATGWQASDKRNLMMTIGKRFDNTDMRVRNIMCKSAAWKLTAGGDGEAMWETEYVGYKKEEGSYSSATWTSQSGGETQDNSPAHYETDVYVGTTFHDENGTGGDMVQLNMKQFNLNIGIPVDESQTFTSGLYTQCPVLSGKYELKWDGIVGRYDSILFQTRLRALTKVVTHVVSTQGWYMKEFMIKKSTLKKAGPDNSEVAEEPLEGSIDYVPSASNTFGDWLEGITELHNSPILMRVRDTLAVNQMFVN